MGLKEIIKRISENKSMKKEKFRQMQEDDRLNTILEERKKSSNQRELERIMKKKEEEQIKLTLDKIRKQEQGNFLKGENMFKGKTTVLTDNKKMFKPTMDILKQKNIFLDNKTQIPITKQEMFFKW